MNSSRVRSIFWFHRSHSFSWVAWSKYSTSWGSSITHLGTFCGGLIGCAMLRLAFTLSGMVHPRCFGAHLREMVFQLAELCAGEVDVLDPAETLRRVH